MLKPEDCSGFDILNHAIRIESAEDPGEEKERRNCNIPKEPQASPPLQSSNSFQFPWKLHDMLEQAEQDGLHDIVAWQGEGNSYGTSFKVFKPQIFVTKLMPKYFKQTKYKSFQRQLNLYGFSRINGGPGKGGYKHKYFLRGNKTLCQYISRQSNDDVPVLKTADAGLTFPASYDRTLDSTVQMPVVVSSNVAFHDTRRQYTISPESSVAQLSPASSFALEQSDITDQYRALVQKDYQFPWKLYEMLEKAGRYEYEHIVCWQPPANSCFKVHDPHEFVSTVMPRFFKQTKFKSFQRQLNLYGFSRVDDGPNRGSYRHRFFQKGRKDLLSSMNRQKNSQSESKMFFRTQEQESATMVPDFSGTRKEKDYPNPVTPNPEPEPRNEPKCIDCGIPKAFDLIEDCAAINTLGSSTTSLNQDGVTWRDPPSKSMSDWIIVVLHNDTFEKDSYNVHRQALAVGDRRSDYFARIFQSNYNFSSNESVLVLGTAEVEVFPQVLDYVYSDEVPKLNMRNAYSFFVLAKHLEIHTLRRMALDFYHESMNKDNIACLIQIAPEFEDETLLQAAVDCCSREMQSMETSLARQLKPNLFHQIILKCQYLPENLRCDDATTSLLLAECLHNHTKSLTPDQLVQMTDQKILPFIDSIAAIKLLAVERDVGNRGNEAFSPAALLLLRERCVLSITKDWKRIRDELDNDPSLALTFKSASSGVLFDILMQISRL